MDKTYDVVVIGGGAAGLSGALSLGRARRSVLVIDAGAPRNAPAAHVHNYLGREGTPPEELLAIGRREVAQYGVEVIAGKVPAASRQADGTFGVTLEGQRISARRLLVATGLADELPDIPGVAEGWGKTVLHCPYCHGWEVRDQTLGILGQGALSIHQAQLFRQLSKDVVLFRHTAPPLSDDEAEQLTARGIQVVEGKVAGWEGGGVRMSGGELVPRQALVVCTRADASAEVLASLGLDTAELEVGGQEVGTYVPADPRGVTAVPGVWVAGNASDPRAQVLTSAAAGLQAGAAINADLIAEETRLAVEYDRVFGADAWETRYREQESRWSGNPNPELVTETSDLAPGTALDVGCGEGADALWLARRGWRVTATDISTVALARAAASARQEGLDVEWRQVDLLAVPPSVAAYDLVSAQFMQLPATKRVSLYGHLAAAVAPGGTLLLVGHHPSDMLKAQHQHPGMHDMFFTAEQLVADLDPDVWEVLIAEKRPRQSSDAEGRQTTIHDTVVRARKR